MSVAKVLYKSFYWKSFQFLVSFLINILLARSFQSVVSAEFYSLVYLLSLAVSFFTFGLDISLNFYLTRRQVSTVMACSIILIAVALALLICLPLLGLFYQPLRYPGISMQNLLLFSGFSIAGGLLTTLSGALFTAHDQSYLPAKISFLLNVGTVLLILLLSRFFSGGEIVSHLFGLYFLVSFVQGLFLFAYSCSLYAGPGLRSARRAQQRFPPHSNLDPQRLHATLPPQLKTILSFSFAAFITNFIFFFGSRMCLYLIPYWMLPSDQGNYIQAYRIVEYMGIAIAFMYYPFMALVARENREAMNARLLFLVRLSNSVVLVFSVFILTVGWWIFPFIFGRSFDRMYSVFIWFIPGLFGVCSSTFFTAYYFGTGHLKYNFISACILLASILLFFLLFIRAWGMAGAALAFSLSSLLSLAYDSWIFRRFSKYRFRDLLFIKRSDIAAVARFIREKGE